jgi:ethanolaminephosphotransferase
VKLLPLWVAPNLITVLGMLNTVVCHLVMLYMYGFTTSGPMDGWFCVYMGISFFMYSVFDNMDGK